MHRTNSRRRRLRRRLVSFEDVNAGRDVNRNQWPKARCVLEVIRCGEDHFLGVFCAFISTKPEFSLQGVSPEAFRASSS